MYTKVIPFKDFKDKPRNHEVTFNLTEREVFKLIREFQLVFDWRESIKTSDEADVRELDPSEVVEFYTAFEEILLTAWGVMSEDGLHFRKAGRYDFEESALFNACMVMFVSDPPETFKLIEEIMPKGLEDLVRKADDNLIELGKAEGGEADLRSEIARLRAQVREGNTSPTDSVAPQE